LEDGASVSHGPTSRLPVGGVRHWPGPSFPEGHRKLTFAALARSAKVSFVARLRIGSLGQERSPIDWRQCPVKAETGRRPGAVAGVSTTAMRPRP